MVDLKVLLPTGDLMTVKIRRNSPCMEVYRLVASAAGLQRHNIDFFALFEIVEHNFGERN